MHAESEMVVFSAQEPMKLWYVHAEGGTMAQLIDNWVTAKDMVRSRAWRLGYESFRLGQTPEFIGRRSKTLAYEYGRLTAAYLRGQGVPLLRMPPNRRANEHYVAELAEALLQTVAE